MKIVCWLRRVLSHKEKMSFKAFWEGIRYLVFVDDTYHEVLYKKRFSFCKDCVNKEFIPLVGNICTECNCILKVKLLIPEEQCPILKWKKEIEIKK